MKLKTIQILKVDNGYVVVGPQEKNYIAEDEEAVLKQVTAMVPFCIELLDKEIDLPKPTIEEPPSNIAAVA